MEYSPTTATRVCWCVLTRLRSVAACSPDIVADVCSVHPPLNTATPPPLTTGLETPCELVSLATYLPQLHWLIVDLCAYCGAHVWALLSALLRLPSAQEASWLQIVQSAPQRPYSCPTLPIPALLLHLALPAQRSEEPAVCRPTSGCSHPTYYKAGPVSLGLDTHCATWRKELFPVFSSLSCLALPPPSDVAPLPFRSVRGRVGYTGPGQGRTDQRSSPCPT